eukprot:7383332-Prymnesium_polylepis.1
MAPLILSALCLSGAAAACPHALALSLRARSPQINSQHGAQARCEEARREEGRQARRGEEGARRANQPRV